MNTLKLYLLTLLAFLLIDMLWLGLFARGLYQRYIGGLMRSPVNWYAALAFYLVFIAALIFFAVRPAITAASGVRALLYGAFFGLVTYATYDLTNLATLKGWSLTISLVDMLWGMVLSGSVAWISFMIGTRLLAR